jgi:uncharacterized protein
MKDMDYAKGYWNPYVAGVALGLVLLLTYFLMGTGLGASGAIARTAAVVGHAFSSNTIEQNGYFVEFYKPGAKHPLINWIVFEMLGVFIGAAVAVITAKRFKSEIGKGPTASAGLRLVLALVGGIISGVGTRFALGCTSGQALSGGAVMAAGSWAFMMAVFGAAFIAAYFVRREWE